MASTAEDGITHRTVAVNGINMHVAEKGSGPVVLLVHGFPELWFSWRRQMDGLAARGYRAVAPDLRGYGDTDAPTDPKAYTYFHIVGDLVALIDSLGQEQVFVVGHDWGAIITWHLCLFRPDKVKALVNLSVPYQPSSRAAKPVQTMRRFYGDDFYFVGFQEPGAIESLFARLGTKDVLKRFFNYRTPGPLLVSKVFEESSDAEIGLPSWMTQDEINYFVSKYDKSGFTGGINYYRCYDLDWELMAPWVGTQIKVPTTFVVGDIDLTYNYPGVKDYLLKGGMKKLVPLLEDVVVVEGAGHFIQQERSEDITNLILDFFQKF